jgi:siroheme synthase-like protein
VFQKFRVLGRDCRWGNTQNQAVRSIIYSPKALPLHPIEPNNVMEDKSKTATAGEGQQFLPVSINITHRPIVLVGGGRVAFHKATLLSRFTDQITVVAPRFHPQMSTLPVRLKQKAYEPHDLEGAFLIYICTENEALNAAIKADCEQYGILASVCDHPALCDFISPAIYKNDHLTIAVSSNAQNVRQSIRIRDRIRELAEEGMIG